jgi:hypothetical protein
MTDETISGSITNGARVSAASTADVKSWRRKLGAWNASRFIAKLTTNDIGVK